MYNVNKNINSEGSTFNYLLPGIHDDAELVSVEYKMSPDNHNAFMVFTFEKDGKTVNHTEWEPSDQDPVILATKQEKQIIRVKHIITKFIPEEQYEFKANSFEEFCKQTIAILGDKYKGVKVRIKVVYNNKNYTTLPRYVKFIEDMSIPREETKLEITDFDKVTKDRADKEAVVNDNPFDTPVETDMTPNETKPVTDDLPF